MRKLAAIMCLSLFIHAAPVWAASAADSTHPGAQFVKARNMLKGENKQTDEAKKILLELAGNSASSLDPSDRCHMYVYLGYIEDRAGNRQAAVEWFRRAANVDGQGIDAIRRVAEIGLTSAVTRLTHLDGKSESAPPVPRDAAPRGIDVIERIGSGLVLRNEPESVSPAASLSQAERLENFDILAEGIDRHFSFFIHKSIDWPEVVARYRPRVQSASTAEEFYRLMHLFVRELNDFHSWLCNYDGTPALGGFSPAVITRLIEGQLVVTDVLKGSDAHRAGLRRGSVIVRIDGLSIEEKTQQIRPLMKVYSSERGFLEQAYRQLMRGPKGSAVSIEFNASAGAPPKKANLRRVISGQEVAAAPDFQVDRGNFLWYGKHPSGCGYIRILTFKAREELADEFDYALEKLKDAPGLIIDVRENPGGYGTAQQRMIGRLISSRTKVSTSYRRNGPRHDDFTVRDEYFEPTGAWQYAGPIALLINPITGSAADLFVCRMISTGRTVTIGATTHGNLTGGGVYIQLPCNLVVRVSGGYIADAKRRIIEGNGNAPGMPAEPTIADVVNGRDSVLETAAQELKRLSAR